MIADAVQVLETRILCLRESVNQRSYSLISHKMVRKSKTPAVISFIHARGRLIN